MKNKQRENPVSDADELFVCFLERIHCLLMCEMVFPTDSGSTQNTATFSAVASSSHYLGGIT